MKLFIYDLFHAYNYYCVLYENGCLAVSNPQNDYHSGAE